MQSTQL